MATDMQERNEQTLNDIQGLQNIEHDLFNQLNQPSLTPEQKNMIITKINEVSQMRMNLYNNLNSMYSFFNANVTSSNATLVEQTNAVKIVEEQLNEAKIKLKKMQKNTSNNMRMVEINTYYGEKYSNYTSILKLALLFCVPILFLTVLFKAEIIPKGIFYFIIIILFFIGIIMVGIRILDAMHRSDMNYNEYTWGFDKKTAPSVNSSSPSSIGSITSDPWATAPASSTECLGETCCYEGTMYNETLNQCVPNSYVAPTNAAATTTGTATGTTTGTATGTASSSTSGSGTMMTNHPLTIMQGGFGGL
uniref:Uncharacterized protein n=1 Tax=viral metagenome TaxID=1070528 RepID=A0A6C0BA65_9ZZZZ